MKIESEKLQQIWTQVHQNSQSVSLGLKQNLGQEFKKLVLKRLLMANILILLLQFIGLKLTSLITPPSFLWFATGTACAFLFLRGYSILPGIWIGTYLGFYLEGVGFWLSFHWANAMTGQSLLLLWFNYRYLKPTLVFSHLQLFLVFLVYCIILTGLMSWALIGICSLTHLQAIFSWQLGLHWWLANLNGILIFSCALVTWDAYFPDFHEIKQKKGVFILFGLLFLLVLILIFCYKTFWAFLFLLLIMLLNLVISTFLGWCGAITASFICAILICLAAMVDAPLLYNSSSSLITLIPLFLAVNTILCLCVALIRNKNT